MIYRAALVTGASSGIGEAIARQLPPETDLLLTGRRADALAGLRAELARPGRRIETLVADLAEIGGIGRVAAAAETFGIDLLVNNAGLGQFGAILANDPVRESEMVMVNVVAPAVLTNALLPGMLRRAREGKTRAGVVIVASVVGFLPVPRAATYAATKAFDLHYALGLADELRKEPVDVLALCPGSTATRFGERAGSAPRLARMGHSAERVAEAGLAALGRRQLVVVGAGNTLMTTIVRLMPLRLLTRLVGLVTASMVR
jgi:short-subunit dehydrogenase